MEFSGAMVVGKGVEKEYRVQRSDGDRYQCVQGMFG